MHHPHAHPAGLHGRALHLDPLRPGRGPHAARGVVLLARDTKLGRLVAIKLLHGGGQAAARLRAEAQATARARHDHIVVIYEVGELDGRPYMVLEYVEGRTLRHVISTGGRGDGRALPPAFALDVMASVVRALAAAHKSGVIHRDLKPENIMLLDSGQVKVLDFGLARLVDSEEPKRRAGTRAYMSPEQWSGERCDLWAAGLIFYELLAGAHPLAPLTSERLETLSDPNTPMPSLSDARPVLAGISEVIGRCLRKNKEERFSSADELLAALEACLAGHGAVAVKGDERPFAGLAAFQEADADRFFGRAPDVAALIGSLARQALVAVATHADAVVARLAASDQSLCRAIFLRLVTPERTRAIVSMRELAELAEDAAVVEAVVRELCDARLLLLDTDGEPGSAKVELVHESLIERWPTLALARRKCGGRAVSVSIARRGLAMAGERRAVGAALARPRRRGGARLL